jgi:hypothetical protein
MLMREPRTGSARPRRSRSSLQDIFGKTKTLRWDEVAGVKKISRALVLEIPAAQILVPSETVGFASFAEAVRKHLNPAVYQQALAAISEE